MELVGVSYRARWAYEVVRAGVPGVTRAPSLTHASHDNIRASRAGRGWLVRDIWSIVFQHPKPPRPGMLL